MYVLVIPWFFESWLPLNLENKTTNYYLESFFFFQYSLET